MHQEFRVGDIKANPYRHIERYPIIPEKVDALTDSFDRTGFWDNVVVRINANGEPEQAYGHHRVAALITKYGPDHRAHFIVKSFDEAAMLRAMADENGEVYGANSAVDIETLRSLLDAWAEGILPLPPAPSGPTRTYLGPGPKTVTYQIKDVAAFFGWPIERRTEAAVEALEAITSGGMKIEAFEGVSIRKAHEAAKQVNRAVKQAKATGDATIVTKVREAVVATMADKKTGSEATIKEAGAAALVAALPRAAKPAPSMTPRDTIAQVQAALKFLDRGEIKLKDGTTHKLTDLIEEIAKFPALGQDYDDVATLLVNLSSKAGNLAALFANRPAITKGK